MQLEFGQTKQLVTTQYAPLAALLAHYHAHQVLQPLHQGQLGLKTCTFTPHAKLKQVTTTSGIYGTRC